MYYFFAPYNNHKSYQISTIRSNRKCSKVIGISTDIFGNVRKSPENRRKSSEVPRTFSEIPVMTRQKSHAFDSEKVSRYTKGSCRLMQFQLQTKGQCPASFNSLVSPMKVQSST